MAAGISVNAIVSYPVIDASLFNKKHLNKILVEELDIIERMYNRTTKTWKPKDVPTWSKKTGGGERNMRYTISTTDTPFVFIDLGTDIRYATMTPDFSRKTNPRILGSRGGSGGVQFVNRGVPRAGIEPRKFSDEIVKRRSPKLLTKLQKEFMQEHAKRVAKAKRAKKRFRIL